MTKTPEFSIELFPPRTEKSIEKYNNAILAFNTLKPKYYSVTFGAGGSSQEATINAIKLLKEISPIDVAPHISCIGSTKTSIHSLLKEYQAIGVKHLVALRGDLPSGMLSPGEFRYANELIEFIRQETGKHFHIEVAAYPEFHPQAPNAKKDMENFKRKIDAGADSAITQYFYNTDAYFRFTEQCQKMGITIPIVPGIMPITNHKQLARFSDNCGAEIPRWIRKQLANFDEDKDSIIEFGKEVVIELCQKLLDAKVPGLHFYSLNSIEPTLAIWQTLKLSGQ